MTEQRIYILTGPTGTGKTTTLVNWSEKRKDVFGILTPIVDGKRIFMNAHTKEHFPMEAGEREEDILKVGRFTFSRKGFDRAAGVLRDAIYKNGWLIVDEIGPLELKGEGFYEIMRDILALRNEKLLLVIREALVDQAREFFKIKNVVPFDQQSG